MVHSTIDTTAYTPLNSLDHCIYTTSMTNIRPGRDSNPLPKGFEPQSDRMMAHSFDYKFSKKIQSGENVCLNEVVFLNMKILHQAGIELAGSGYCKVLCSNHVQVLSVPP